jgi:hypothetical protein
MSRKFGVVLTDPTCFSDIEAWFKENTLGFGISLDHRKSSLYLHYPYLLTYYTRNNEDITIIRINNEYEMVYTESGRRKVFTDDVIQEFEGFLTALDRQRKINMID